ncbi:MAG: exosortase/archaeosortase family protein [Chitinophagaceae bacterium]|nr:exosortase/archaeosortase family protein [Chitinophagaceae bacterium]
MIRFRSKITEWIDVSYLMRFIILLLILYYGNLVFIAIIDHKGLVYSQFFDKHFNYINWLRNSLLYTSNLLAHTTGLNTHVTLPFRLTSQEGSYIEIVYECLGINFFCFWTAFVWANKPTNLNNFYWWLIGMLGLWFLNSVRITLLLMAIVNQWHYNRYMDHHTLFNLATYSLIALFIFFYINSRKHTNLKPAVQTMS